MLMEYDIFVQTINEAEISDFHPLAHAVIVSSTSPTSHIDLNP